MALAHLSIGTATDRIDLLDKRGFHAGDWLPGAEGTDDTFSESSLSDYRRLASYRRMTTIEVIPLTLKRQSQNQTAQATRKLRQMLETAKDYWASDHQFTPVYLEARASCEDKARYALIFSGELPQDGNPFREPFLQRGRRSIMAGLLLGLERGAWGENAPGTGTAIELSALEAYDGRNLGNVDSTGTRDPTTAEGEVYIGNKHNQANITDIWYWDNSAAAWNGANLMDAAVPFAFMPPAPMQVDDFVLFGIDTALANSGPFASLVFDIGTALGVGGGITIEWRYSRGGVDPSAPWPDLDVQDNTNADGLLTGDPFDTTGVKSAHWVQPSDWTEHNPQVGAGPILGTTGFWVCAYVTAAAGAPTPPQQRSRDIYTITWPYTEIQAAQIGGDMPALLTAKIRCQGDNGVVGVGNDPYLSADRIYMGARSLDRGADFSAYVNVSDEQNPLGWTVTPATALTTDPSMPTGRVWRITSALPNRLRFQLSAAYVAQYYGTYRWLVRGSQVGGAVFPTHEIYAQARITNSGVFTTTDTTMFVKDGLLELLDFGMLTIPLTNLVQDTEPVTGMTLDVWITGDGVNAFDFVDMILLPVDEWAGDCPDNLLQARGTSENSYVYVDSIEFPKVSLRVFTADFGTDALELISPYIANGPAALDHDQLQRVWFLMDCYHCSSSLFTDGSAPEVASSIQAWRQQRYFSMRGDS